MTADEMLERHLGVHLDTRLSDDESLCYIRYNDIDEDLILKLCPESKAMTIMDFWLEVTPQVLAAFNAKYKELGWVE